MAPIIAAAASASAVPLARVSLVSATRQLRFSITAWPMWHSLAAAPVAFLSRRTSGPVVEACVSLLSVSPRKSRGLLRRDRAVRSFLRERIVAFCPSFSDLLPRARARTRQPGLCVRSVRLVAFDADRMYPAPSAAAASAQHIALPHGRFTGA